MEDEKTSKAELMGYIYAGVMGGGAAVAVAVAKWAFPALAGALGLGALGTAILTGVGIVVIGVIFAAISYFATQQCGSVANWVQTKLRLEHNDGFAWWWDLSQRVYVYARPTLYDDLGHMLWWIPFLLTTWHFCDWKQSWGADRETAVETISTDYMIDHYGYPMSLR